MSTRRCVSTLLTLPPHSIVDEVFYVARFQGSKPAIGRSRIWLTVEDWSGQLAGLAPLSLATSVAKPGIVRVAGTLEHRQDKRWLDISGLSQPDPGTLDCPGELLRWSACTPQIRPAVQRLVDFGEQLPGPLRLFLSSVLHDADVAPDFISSAATVNGHHAYPGGFIIYSVALLERVGEIVALVPSTRRDLACIAQVAYLLRGIGSMWAVKVQDTFASPFVRSAFFITRILERQLRALAVQDVHSASLLVRVLQTLDQELNHRDDDVVRVVEAIRSIDRLAILTDPAPLHAPLHLTQRKPSDPPAGGKR